MSNLRTIFSAVTGWTESNVVVDVPGALDHAATQAHFVTDGYFSVVGVASRARLGLSDDGSGRPRRVAADGRDLRCNVGGRIRSEGREQSDDDGERCRGAHRRRCAAAVQRPAHRRSAG